jgi:hypothetical protein
LEVISEVSLAEKEGLRLNPPIRFAPHLCENEKFTVWWRASRAVSGWWFSDFELNIAG